MEKCDVKTGTCESAVSSTASCKAKCSCGGVCGGDPVKCAMYSWKGAFHLALEEVMLDVLKARIHKTFGPKLEKSADAIMDAMNAKWQAKIMMAQAETELWDRIKEDMLNK